MLWGRGATGFRLLDVAAAISAGASAPLRGDSIQNSLHPDCKDL